jgi:hypothetical protein
MNKRFWLTSAATLLGGLALATVQASDTPLKTFEELDTNGDGYISQSEAQVVPDLMGVDHMAKYDTNKDGKLDKAEYSVYQAKHAPQHAPTTTPTP